MAYSEGHFEQKDTAGTTIVYSGSAFGGVTLPASAGNFISEFLFVNTGNNDIDLDFGGTSMTVTKSGGFLIWTPKSTKQFSVTGNSTYESIINFEDHSA